jgi:ribosomal protein L16/L10AE
MAPIKKGQVICEVITFFLNKMDISKKALESGGTKLPLKTCIVSNFY